MTYFDIQEEELKGRIEKDIFWQFDCTKIIGNIDFCVCLPSEGEELFEGQSLFWAEAKSNESDIYNSISQLVLTIGKGRIFDNHLPPPFLGAFDAEKVAFIHYNEIADIFYLNDFNWNVKPSDYKTREFKLIREKVESILDLKALIFYYERDNKELERFIRQNLLEGKFGVSKVKIDKNNFMVIYNKWLENVKDSILLDWELAKKSEIIDGDFYLADLLSEENKTLKDKLNVLLRSDHYELERHIDDLGLLSIKSVNFRDKQIAHTQFWNRYKRPPIKEYWDYIVRRRDLLVPQDIRERRGSFFTPRIWVELSQDYLAEAFGENWQEEYYIWDCAAGTGNLLAGLTNKYRIWASTLDKQDVDVMYDRINNGANLLESHVFQFDFLNDDFSKLPASLLKIINDPEERKKLIIYMNPPYAEAGNTKQRTGTGKNKEKTTTQNATYEKYKTQIGKASNELFTQFLIRMYFEIPDCKIGVFSKLKNLQAPNFSKFRNLFLAKLENIFIVPANTFDNVNGNFPIGFQVWNTEIKEKFSETETDIFNKKREYIGKKKLYSFDDDLSLTSFTHNGINDDLLIIGHFASRGNNFQGQNAVFVDNIEKERKGGGLHVEVASKNLLRVAVSFTVRLVIKANWLNDRDIFLFPNESWKKDLDFISDCLTFILFDSQNKITSKLGINHWIPFREVEVNSKEKFDSNFMTDFISGKLKAEVNGEMFLEENEDKVISFSEEAMDVFDVGLDLWKYYHKQDGIDVNASLYDIREYFQGRSSSGRMNSSSDDMEYMNLINRLRDKLKILSFKLESKVYKYGFLKK